MSFSFFWCLDLGGRAKGSLVWVVCLFYDDGVMVLCRDVLIGMGGRETVGCTDGS